MITIYHNNRCTKSRAGVQFVKDRTDDYKIIEYLKTPLSREDLNLLLMRLNKKAVDMVRTQEAIFKSDFKGKNFTNEEWMTIILENPKLLKRPIVVKENKAVWGNPVEELEILF